MISSSSRTVRYPYQTLRSSLRERQVLGPAGRSVSFRDVLSYPTGKVPLQCPYRFSSETVWFPFRMIYTFSSRTLGSFLGRLQVSFKDVKVLFRTITRSNFKNATLGSCLERLQVHFKNVSSLFRTFTSSFQERQDPFKDVHKFLSNTLGYCLGRLQVPFKDVRILFIIRLQVPFKNVRILCRTFKISFQGR